MQDSIIYPIGQFEPAPFSEAMLRDRMLEIRFLPQLLENTIQQLDEYQLNTPYRKDGWTVKQVVHHIADSHMNAFVRFKLALTEDNPTIKPYDQDKWVNMADVELPVNVASTFIHALHLKWHELMVHMSTDDWKRTLYHPEYKEKMDMWHMLGKYAWHGKHHVAQISALIEREGWK